MAEAGRYISRFSPDFIDVNLGCPMRKVVNNNGGSALMRDLKLMERIFKQLVSAVSIPITAKIRSGWSNQELNAVEVAQLLEECGVKAIAVHGRTRTMMFTGKADWSIIKEVKSSVKIPVIGNGDVKSPESAKQMFDETGCDAVMIGRASFGNPWIFKRINHYLSTCEILNEPTAEEKINVCIHHLKLIIEDKGEYVGIREMRKHINWYVKGLRNATELRVKIMKEEKMDNVEKLLREFIC
jgi:tRNA-dihydrouridine synthase B